MANITRAFTKYGDTVEVSYTFDDVTGVLLSVDVLNNAALPVTFRVIHPVLGTWARNIPAGVMQSHTPPTTVMLPLVTTSRGMVVAFPGRYEFVGPH